MMKRKLTIFLLLALIVPFFSMGEDAAPAHPRMSIVGTLDIYVGSWTGKQNMSDEKIMRETSWTEHLNVKPVLDNKFILMESSTEPDSHGKVSREMKLAGYDQDTDEYILYLFDSDGFMGRFVGKKLYDTITYKEDAAHGEQLQITMTEQGQNQFRVVTEKINGSDVASRRLMDVTYTKDIVPRSGEERQETHSDSRHKNR